jgi:hypothetical protein
MDCSGHPETAAIVPEKRQVGNIRAWLRWRQEYHEGVLKPFLPLGSHITIRENRNNSRRFLVVYSEAV